MNLCVSFTDSLRLRSDKVGHQGYTPLHLACDRGNLITVDFLLAKGADPTIKVNLFYFCV